MGRLSTAYRQKKRESRARDARNKYTKDKTAPLERVNTSSNAPLEVLVSKITTFVSGLTTTVLDSVASLRDIAVPAVGEKAGSVDGIATSDHDTTPFEDGKKPCESDNNLCSGEANTSVDTKAAAAQDDKSDSYDASSELRSNTRPRRARKKDQRRAKMRAMDVMDGKTDENSADDTPTQMKSQENSKHKERRSAEHLQASDRVSEHHDEEGFLTKSTKLDIAKDASTRTAPAQRTRKSRNKQKRRDKTRAKAEAASAAEEPVQFHDALEVITLEDDHDVVSGHSLVGLP
ncbi:hypothetical protein ACHAQA_001630 [Verticillium albo-atrum]